MSEDRDSLTGRAGAHDRILGMFSFHSWKTTMCRDSPFQRPRPAVLAIPRGAALGLPLALLVLATPATAQIVTGRVIDASDDEPIDGVEISLLDTLDATRSQVVSNANGEFMIVFNAPGEYLLRATRIGYATAETRPIPIGEGEVVEVELRLDVEAVELEPLSVVARRPETQRERDLRGYHERIERYGERQVGPTQIYTREVLANWDAYSLEELFGSYLLWRPYGSDCSPEVFLDGRRMYGPFLGDAGSMSVSNIEGIELYAGSGPKGSRFWDPDGCGVILVWTRALPERGGKLSPVEILALGAAAVLLVVQAAWLAF